MAPNTFTPDRRTVLSSLAASVVGGTVGTGTVSARAEFEPLASIDMEGGVAEGVVSEDGQTAYVSLYEGVAIVDVSDPENPTEIARRTDSGLQDVWDVKVEGDRLIVVGPSGVAGDVNGMALYDVSDPSNPEELAFYETEYPIHNAYLTEDIAYIINSADATINLIDVSDDDPTKLTEWSLSEDASILHDVWVQDDVAYLSYWDDGTVMLDVSSPSDPSMIGKVRDGSDKYPNNDHYTTLNEAGTILAIGKEEMVEEPLGVELWDVSDKTDTEFLAEIQPPESGSNRTSHNLDIVGDYLYTSWYYGGVRVHDISDPSDPQEVASFQSIVASFWTAKVAVPGEFFISTNSSVQGGDGGFYTFPDPADDGGGGNRPPTASVDASPTNPSVGETVSVDASASSDPDGSIDGYEWEFGDGETATGETATHAYESTGEYTVEVTVTDDDGATDSASELITVGDEGGECGAETETTTESGFLAWWNGDAVHTYATKTSDPCGVTVELEGPGFANFDLYVTYDGRTPTRDDYDDRSAGSGASESVSSDLDGATDVGILVDGADGWGEYSVTIGERGR
ncbi:PKD domain-containing protein [Halovivax limisalsi]|uniref:PKD domain-containing protein n=1 Tax=Halovivax limisalsi TaxID=1453760 RepID=UPI001FFD20F5|nr:PKD domain-containing protein [Halovivax limisalsi]